MSCDCYRATYDVYLTATCIVDDDDGDDAYNRTIDADDDDDSTAESIGSYDEYYNETLCAIRCNDPNVTSVSFDDNWYRAPRPRDGKIWWRGVKALRGNTVVTKMCFHFAPRLAKYFDVDSALRMIKKRRELASLELRYVPMYGRRIGLCNRFVFAASQNPSIHFIHIYNSQFSAESLLLLLAGTGTAMNLRKLSICSCTILPSLEATPANVSSFEELLERAAQYNSTLTELTFDPIVKSDVDNHYMICILNGLALSVQSKLETLELQSVRSPVDVNRAIQGLLLSTTATKLRTLCLRNCRFKGATFPPLAHGLSHGVSAVALTLRRCSFDKESTLLFRAAFQAGNHSGSLSSLCVEGNCKFWDKRAGRSGTPLGPSSQLKQLQLSLEDEIGADVSIVMQSVGRSPMLEFLNVIVQLPRDYNVWAACLPRVLTLKSLHVTLAWTSNLNPDNSSLSRFVETIRKNSTLIDVVSRRGNDDQFLDNVSLAKVARYTERNMALSRLRGSERSLPAQLWPSLAKSVRRCEYGLGWIVRMMLALEQQQQQPMSSIMP